jgi:DNA polymerase-3 subunit delta
MVRVVTPEALMKELKGTAVAAVYLLAGPDAFRAERTARWLRRKVLEQDALDLNAEVFYAEDASPATIAHACATYPLLGERRFVWVRHAEALAAGAAVEPLLAYLRSPSPSTVLVISSAKLDLRLKLTLACAEQGRVVEFPTLALPALLVQAQRLAQERGVQLGPGAAETLVELVGEDLGELDNELAKLALLADAGVLGAERIAELVARSRDLSAFALADQLDARDPLPALRTWLAVRSSGVDVIGTAAILGWKLRQLAQFRAALDAGLGEEAASRALGISPWQGRRLAQLARGVTLSQVERALACFRTADRRAKSSSMGEGMAYDLALLAWAAGGAARLDSPP